jgi:nitrite reductase/ring-hydroxylating ferredoxin subunit
MTQRHFACLVDAMDKGTSRTVEGPDAEPAIALFRTDEGEFHATADTCTYEKWSLGEDSDLEGTEVVCPLHLARFDIRTGEALCFPATTALRTFPVEVEDGRVYILR